MKTVALIPAYNAEKTIEEVIYRIPREFIDQLIVVDDGSQDRTLEILKQFEWVTVIQHDGNKGYGHAQITLHRAALDEGAECVVILHADLGHSPEEIPIILDPVQEGKCDIAQGSRILGIKNSAKRVLGSKLLGAAIQGPMPGYKYIANRFITFAENILTGAKLSEYHTGYRAFSRELLEQLDMENNSDDFVFDNQMLAQILWHGHTIAEASCPTKYFPDASSINFRRSLKYGFGCLWTCFVFRLAKMFLIKSKLFPK